MISQDDPGDLQESVDNSTGIAKVGAQRKIRI